MIMNFFGVCELFGWVCEKFEVRNNVMKFCGVVGLGNCVDN